MGRTDYVWRCCYCHGSFISVKLNEHCSDCSRRKCSHCEVIPAGNKKHMHHHKGEPIATRNTQAQSVDERIDLRPESAKDIPSAPPIVDDILVCQADSSQSVAVRDPPTSSLSLPYVYHKPTDIPGWLGSVDEQSCAERSSIGSHTGLGVLDDAPEVDSPDPVSDIDITNNHNSNTPYSASRDRRLFPGVAASAVESPIQLSHPGWLDPLLHHPLYHVIVKAWAEVWSEDLVDQDDSNGSTQQSTPSSSDSVPDNRYCKKPSRGNKRERESDNEDEPEDAKKVKTTGSNDYPAATEGADRLACHFYKMNPRLHLTCMRKNFKRINAVRQHLDQHHKLGSVHCQICWVSFASEMERRRHTCNPTGGKPVHLLPRVPRTDQGHESQWYWIWDQLFPRVPRPDTPYYTDKPDHPLIQQFADFFADRFAPTIAARLGSDPSVLSVVEDIQAAVREWGLTPPYTLNIRQLPTPATTVSDYEIRTSPAPLRMLPEDTNIYRDPQPSGLLTNGVDESMASSALLGRENLLDPGQEVPVENIEDRVEAVDIPSGHTGGMDPMESAETSADHDSGRHLVPSLQEEMDTSLWNAEQASNHNLSDGISHQHWTFAGGSVLEEVDMSTWNPQQLPIEDPSHGMYFEQWAFAGGMTEDDHLRMVLDHESIEELQFIPREDMDEIMNRPGDPDAEDQHQI